MPRLCLDRKDYFKTSDLQGDLDSERALFSKFSGTFKKYSSSVNKGEKEGLKLDVPSKIVLFRLSDTYRYE